MECATLQISCVRAYREKKLLVGSDDYGRDLTGVQNLRKKHKRLEAELSSHEPSIQVSVCVKQHYVHCLCVVEMRKRNCQCCCVTGS